MTRLPSYRTLAKRGTLITCLSQEVIEMDGKRYLVEWKRGRWVVVGLAPHRARSS